MILEGGMPNKMALTEILDILASHDEYFNDVVA